MVFEPQTSKDIKLIVISDQALNNIAVTAGDNDGIGPLGWHKVFVAGASVDDTLRNKFYIEYYLPHEKPCMFGTFSGTGEISFVHVPQTSDADNLAELKKFFTVVEVDTLAELRQELTNLALERQGLQQKQSGGREI